jgi:hypothetical protein
MDLVLGAGTLANKRSAPRDPAAQTRAHRVGNPHRLEHPSREQLRERTRIETVGLHPCVRDRPHLLGVGDHHPRDMRLDDPGDLHRRAGRLHHYLVGRAETLREQLQRVAAGRDTTG